MLLRSSAIFFVLLICCSSVFGAKRKTKAVYCVRSADAIWNLQRFQPLINTRGGTFFAELSFAGSVLEAARLRRFFPDHELVFDYKFDAAGRLTGLLGSVEMWGQWLGEADLTPEADGSNETVHVKYYRAGSRDSINRPEDAQSYAAELTSTPVIKTIEALPCGSLLHEAEKMNATQE